MAKIYYNRYMDRVRAGEITIQEAIALAEVEIHPRWRPETVRLLRAELPEDEGAEPEN